MTVAPAKDASHFGRGERVRTARSRGEFAPPAPVRREERVAGVCVVEYGRYPTLPGAASRRIGFTRDLSRGGLCLGVDEPEPVGALVRFRFRAEGAERGPTRVARVAWCAGTRDGRHWLGLECLAGTRPHSALRLL